MNQKLQQLLDSIQQSAHLSDDEKNTLAKTVKDVDKEMEITSFKLDRTEKVKKTASILLEETIEELEQKRKAVEAQNRELEIESSLERVRTVALSMNRPDDMLHVCRVISEQLQHLNVQEIRNVQTAIFYETKGTYINYEFYAKHDKSLVTEVNYKDHDVSKAFADQMTKGPNEIFIHGFNGKEVQDWYEFQKTTNVFIDTYLETANSLNYYWYSLGPVALGISTYKPLTEEQTNLFKRFLKVFELSYRRYLDIEKAEAQAHEAKVEVSLEKVRAVAMSLRKSEDLIAVCEVMYKELVALGFTNIRNAQIAIKHDEKQAYVICEYSDYAVNILQEAPYNSSSIVQELYNELGKTGDALYQKEFSGKEFEDWRRWRKSIKDSIDVRIDEAVSMCFYLFSMGTGHVGISTFNAISNEQVEILKRFKNVFELSYRRYTDVAKAETQAREAQIELALERVRARTMAMQKSDELAETSLVLFQQFKDLGEISEQISIGIFNEDEHVMELYSTLYGSQWKEAVKVDLDEPVVMKKIHRAWKEQTRLPDGQEKSLVIDLSGKPLREYNAYRKKLSNLEYREDRWVIHIAFFSKGVLTFSITDPHPQGTVQLLERFAGVFEQTYTRFLDLQKAEAQAREAKIEAALERVRSNTMAMHHSEELKEVISVTFEQLKSLNITIDSCVITLFIEGSDDLNNWVASAEQKYPQKIRVPYFKHPLFDKIVLAKNKPGSYFTLHLSQKENQTFYKHVLENSDFGKIINEDRRKLVMNADNNIMSFANFQHTGLRMGNFRNHTYTQEENNTILRFAAVFEQTYTRFLDLQKAEAQAREAQIELGLERVRARAMAMQKSDELSELVDTVFKELTKLDFALTWCIINIIDEPSLSNTVWAANPDITKAPESYHMLFEDYPFHHAMMKGWKERNSKSVYTLEGDEKRIYDDYLFSETEFKRTPEAAQAASRAMEKYVVSFSFSNFGGLQTVGIEPLSDANLDILARFGKVFDLTYTRFNDLKQAEAQARESQIQLALERVRARTMAMQHSDELKEAAALLFQQAKALGVPAYSCGYNIWEKGDKVFTSWMSTQDGSIINGVPNIPLTEDANFIRYVESKQKGEQFFVLELRGERMQEHYEYLKTIPAFKAYFDYAISVGFDLPETQIHYLANFSQGNLLFISLKPCPEFHDVFKRFAAVFEQTYTRFLDLQKAEAQAREAQIELGLERVRARAMAMQNSDELSGLVAILFEELVKLDLILARCIIWIFDADTLAARVWMANSEDKRNAESYFIRRLDHPYYDAILKGWKERNPKWVYDLRGKNKRSIDKLLLNETELAHLPDAVKAGILSSEHTIISGSFNNFGLIEASGPVAHSEEQLEILNRFGKVFDLSYTRFNDLKQAEAQAREAQIEAALERVRSRSMGMQKSEELKEVIQVVYEQFVHLNIHVEHTGFVMDYKARDDYDIWIADQLGVPSHVTIPYFDCVYYNRFNEAKKKGEDFFVTNLDFEEKNRFYRKIIEYVSGLPEKTKEFLFSIPGLAASTVLLENVGLYIENFSGIPYSDEENNTLMRFGKVFQQTYTRFLDLQKAEAQAREAQIQLALERGRTQSMIMQHSKELDDTLRVFHEQVLLLGINSAFSFLWLPDEEKSNHIFWAAWAEDNNDATVFKSKAITYPLDRNEPATAQCLVDWKSGEPVFSYAVPPEGVQSYFAAWQELIDGVEKLTPEHFTNGLYYVEAFMKYGCFGVMLESDLNGNEKKILNRFAIEFERAYTRFLDLQKAEAQAREATIETALERVRSRSMGMQKSEELKEVIQIVYEQFVHLNMHVEHTGFIMDYKERNDMHIWLADKHAVPFQVTIPYFDCAHWNSFNEAKEKGKDFFANHLSFEEKNKFYQDLFKLIPGVPEETLKYYFSCPGLAISTVLLENIGLYIENFSGIPYRDEENNTLMRFGKVFQQTYTRFLDLQKAEAQAREAIRQASLDRVRGQIASMRSTEDLQRITPLIWHELTTLDVPFIRCGVLIVDEGKGEAHIYLSSPDGHSLAAMNLPLQSNTLTANSVAYWRKGLVYTEHWSKEDFIHWMKSMIEQGQVQNPETYQGAARPPESLHLHFVPFTQGMLYVGNTALLTSDEIDLVKSLAEAFSIAYARYEDFTKLEKAKQSIEITLTELKATQTQLIQSEKMASLGELTAGIAHEIQNPLNFVNNFSEVSKELLDEMKEELDKGNTANAKEIAEDVIQNLEKINHHGKRADAIVKGMLQHSRSSTGVKEPTDINALADEYLRLAFHGLRAKDKSFNANMKTDYDATLEKVNVIPQDIGRVILNLITNAFYAVHEKAKQQTNGYEPTISVSTKKLDDKIFISVKDNGGGIPQKVVDKIFQPFFTTKPTGQGTGLGLSLSYDIMKAHGGEIKVETKEGEGSEFIIQLPII